MKSIIDRNFQKNVDLLQNKKINRYIDNDYDL